MASAREGVAVRPTLSSAASRAMIDGAVAEAARMSTPVTIVVVDESGVTKEMLRMDGAPLVSVQTAIDKAYAAAAIGMAPDDFSAAIKSDGAAVGEFARRPVWRSLLAACRCMPTVRFPGRSVWRAR